MLVKYLNYRYKLNNKIYESRQKSLNIQAHYDELAEQFNKAVRDSGGMVLPGDDMAFSMARENISQSHRRESARPLKCESDYLVREASLLRLPLPSRDGDDYWCFFDLNEHYLNDNGVQILRGAIRKERKENFEALQIRTVFFLSIIGSVTGIASLIIAFYKKQQAMFIC